MSRIRVFLFWLLMLAVPLQGFAAVSMGLCGTAGQPAHVAIAETAVDHASSHEGHHGPQMQAHPHHASGMHGGDAASHADGFHKCASCAACHAVALMDLLHPAQTHLLPQAEPAGQGLAMATQVPRVPDKPPRA